MRMCVGRLSVDLYRLLGSLGLIGLLGLLGLVTRVIRVIRVIRVSCVCAGILCDDLLHEHALEGRRSGRCVWMCCVRGCVVCVHVRLRYCARTQHHAPVRVVIAAMLSSFFLKLAVISVEDEAR